MGPSKVVKILSGSEREGERDRGDEWTYTDTYERKEPVGGPILECEPRLVDHPVTTAHTQLPRPFLLLLHQQLLRETHTQVWKEADHALKTRVRGSMLPAQVQYKRRCVKLTDQVACFMADSERSLLL